MPQDNAQLCVPRAIVTAHGLYLAEHSENECQKWVYPGKCVWLHDRTTRVLLEVGYALDPTAP